MDVELSEALVHALRSRAAKADDSNFQLFVTCHFLSFDESWWPLEVAKTGRVVMALSVWSPDEEA